MGDISKEVSKILESYGSKIIFLLFLLDLLITSSIWITEKLTFELGLGHIFTLNTYALLPYIINLILKRKEPNKREHVIIIDFYSSITFWGISLSMGFSEFSVLSYYFILFYLGLFTSIIYFLVNPKPKRDSSKSIILFIISIFIVLASILLLIMALSFPLALLPLETTEMRLFWLIFYLVLLITLIIIIFKPEVKKGSS